MQEKWKDFMEEMGLEDMSDPTENGFDGKLDYQTQKEAEKIARDYVAGKMDEDGFKYEGAAVFDLQERQWLYVAGHFPVLDGEELPYLPYKLDDKPAQAQQEQASTVRELYEKYKAEIITALSNDQPYRSACQNSDKENAYIGGGAAIKRAVIAAEDDTLTKLYFDNSKFHKDIHREALDETYPLFSQLEQVLPEQAQPEQDNDTPARKEPTELQKKAIEIAKRYENLSMDERLGIIAQTFGCTTGKIETSPCTGKWRGTSDISIRFDNGVSLFIGNRRTPQAKTARVQNEYINSALVSYNPEIVSLTKEAALPILRKREAKDNEIATQKGLKPYTLLNVEFNNTPSEWNGGYLGWYYVTLAVDGKICSHMETGLYFDIADGKVSETPTRDSYSPAGAFKDTDVDYVFNNVGFSSTSTLYSLPISDEVRERAEKMLAERKAVLNVAAEGPAAHETGGRGLEVLSDPDFQRYMEKEMEESPQPHDPAYKAGDTVYLDNTAFTIIEVGEQDVYLQSLTPANQISRSKDKAVFENLLRQDERNKYITDFLSADLEWCNGDLFEVLTSEYGFFSQEEKDEISSWIRSGETNSQISEKMGDQFSYRSDSMELGNVRADHDSSGDGLTIFLVDPAPNEDEEYPKEIISASWDEITEIVRAMYQQELGGFHHETPAQEITPDTSQHDTSAPQDSITPVSPQTWTEPVAIYPAEKNNLPFDIVIETLHIEEPQRGPKPQNYHITDDNLGAGGAKAKYQMNMAALRSLQKIESENRTATPEEQDILSKYVGWGALADAFDEDKPSWAAEYKELQETLTPEEYESARASTLNAHYTSPTVIKAIYQALENMGFKGGNILEPSCGVGNFFGLLPDSMGGSKLYGVELDGLTGRIAKQLYPNAHIEIKGYENTNFQNNSFDLAIGNVPFGNYRVHDPAYNKLGFSIHNYFFAKAINQVRPGGIVAFVTSRHTMDSKTTDAREYIAQRAELLGAIRLPENAFLANAGTEVVTDILFLQKREQSITTLPDWVFTQNNKDGFAVNSYFIRHPEMVLGKEIVESTQYGPGYTVAPLPDMELSSMLSEAITHIKGHYVEAKTVHMEDEKEQETLPADPEVKNFSYTIIKGDVYYRQDSVMVKMEPAATAKARITALIDLRDCTRQLINEQMELTTRDEEIKSTQAELNRLYDNFTRKFGLINDKMNERAFSDDSSYYLLCALEILDDEGKFVRKADMFTKRTILPRQEITHVDTAADALAVSIEERARVDIPFMAGLTGKTEEEIINELQGQIFRVPFREPPIYQTADEYLSGNVRDKLNVAEVAADGDPAFNINVNALAAVQPKDLDASEISVRLGTDWIDPEYVEQFMYELLKTPGYLREDIHVQYSSVIHAWNITHKGIIQKNNVAAYITYGTSRVNAYKLLEDALNLQNTRVYDTKTVNGEDKRELNAKETTLAQQKQDMIMKLCKARNLKCTMAWLNMATSLGKFGCRSRKNSGIEETAETNDSAVLLSIENHSQGEWFKRRLLPMM